MSKCFQKSSKYLLPRWLDPQSRPSLRRCLGVQTPIWKTYSRTPWEKSECLQVDLQFFAGHFKTPSQNIQISPTTKGLGHSTWHAGNRCHSCGLQVWKHKPVKCWQCYRVIIWVIIEVCKCYSLVGDFNPPEKDEAHWIISQKIVETTMFETTTTW